MVNRLNIKKALKHSYDKVADRKLIELVSLFGGVLCALYALVTLPIHNYEYTITSFITSAICWIVFFLNRSSQYILALVVFFAGLSTMMLVYTWRFGNINAEIYLIAGGVFSSFLVKRKKLSNEVLWIFITMMFLASQYLLFYKGRYAEADSLEKLLYLPNTLAGLSLIYLVTRFFRNSEEEQREQLNKANELKERLIFILSHDLRTPIN
jgi:signal transduction histidine kinase